MLLEGYNNSMSSMLHLPLTRSTSRSCWMRVPSRLVAEGRDERVFRQRMERSFLNDAQIIRKTLWTDGRELHFYRLPRSITELFVFISSN